MVLSKQNIWKKLFWFLPYRLRYTIARLLRNEDYRINQDLRSKNIKGRVQTLYGYDQLKCIFVHIPKAGGVSLKMALFNNLGGSHRSIKDYSLIFNKSDFETYYKFTVVRNPFDRLASAYFFLNQGGLNQYDKDWFKANIAEYRSFDEFVLRWVNPKNVLTGIHFVPQNKFITINEKIVLDSVYKMEKLNEAIQEITNKLNLPKVELQKLNANSKNYGYRELYSEEMADVVRNVFKKDFELLDYSRRL